jgi:hypothetical protein
MRLPAHYKEKSPSQGKRVSAAAALRQLFGDHDQLVGIDRFFDEEIGSGSAT